MFTIWSPAAQKLAPIASPQALCSMMVIVVTLLASELPAGAENPFRKLLSDEGYEKAKKGLKPRFEELHSLNHYCWSS